ncbi:MAG: hypothetical protein HYR62_04485 [Actinobacteria bacterium]|nr:hypothetical protein [Actinomycetota bacterium]MBI3686312.1 hypothetical protein [Actinomycetota bacterium]
MQFWLGAEDFTNYIADSVPTFPCARRYDKYFSVRAGSSLALVGQFCPFGGGRRRTRHGSGFYWGFLNSSFTYTPDPGYVGPDQFNYVCTGGAEAYGTVFITVLPPLPELAATGATLTRLALSGMALLGVGSGTLLLTRTRRRRVPQRTRPHGAGSTDQASGATPALTR